MRRGEYVRFASVVALPYNRNNRLDRNKIFAILEAAVLAPWIIRSKTSPSRRKKIFIPCLQTRGVGVESDVVNSRLMLERRYSHVMEKFLLWLMY